MTETISAVPEQINTQQLAQQLVDRARAARVDLVCPGGLLAGLTETVLETALEVEMTEHLATPSTTRAAATAEALVTEISTVPGPYLRHAGASARNGPSRSMIRCNAECVSRTTAPDAAS